MILIYLSIVYLSVIPKLKQAKAGIVNTFMVNNWSTEGVTHGEISPLPFKEVIQPVVSRVSLLVPTASPSVKLVVPFQIFLRDHILSVVQIINKSITMVDNEMRLET